MPLFYEEEFLQKFGLKEPETLPKNISDDTMYVYQEIKGKPYFLTVPPNTHFYYIYFSLLRNAEIKKGGRVFLSVFSLRVGKKIVDFSDIGKIRTDPLYQSQEVVRLENFEESEKDGNEEGIYYPIFNNRFVKFLYFGVTKNFSPQSEKWLRIYQKENLEEKEILIPRGYLKKASVQEPSYLERFEDLRNLERESQSLLEKEKSDPVYDLIYSRCGPLFQKDFVSGDTPMLEKFGVKKASLEWLQNYELLAFLKKNNSPFPISGEFSSLHLFEKEESSISSTFHFLKSFYPGIDWSWNAYTKNKYLIGDYLKYREFSEGKDSETHSKKIFAKRYNMVFFDDKNFRLGQKVLMSSDLLYPRGCVFMKNHFPLDHNEREILYIVSCCFEKTFLIKPKTSPGYSSEIFIVGFHYLGKNPYQEILAENFERQDISYFPRLPKYFLDKLFSIESKLVEEKQKSVEEKLLARKREKRASVKDLVEYYRVEAENFSERWLEENEIGKIASVTSPKPIEYD